MTIMQIAVLSQLRGKVGVLKRKKKRSGKTGASLLNNGEFKFKDIFGKQEGIGGSRSLSLGVISTRGLLILCFPLLITQVLSNGILSELLKCSGFISPC